jgi:hypothetical protein
MRVKATVFKILLLNPEICSSYSPSGRSTFKAAHFIASPYAEQFVLYEFGSRVESCDKLGNLKAEDYLIAQLLNKEMATCKRLLRLKKRSKV